MIRFTCPHCEKSLRAPESRGGTLVKCPSCGEKLSIPEVEVELPPPEEGEEYRAAPPPSRRRAVEEAEDDLAEEQRQKRKRRQLRERRQGMEKVNLGLGFHYARLVMMLGTLLGNLVVGAVAGVAVHNPDLIPVVDVLAVVLMGSAVIEAILGINGSIFCLFVPASSNARGIILASLVLDLIALPLAIVMFLIEIPDVPGMLMALASWILFMLFLRRLATFVRE